MSKHSHTLPQRLLIWWIDPATLPHDFPPDDPVSAAFYRFSVGLNRATGGARDMTFSARCHRNASRHGAAAYGWTLVAGVVDLGFASTRGEIAHCATAWENYQVRTWPVNGHPLHSGQAPAS